MAYYLDQEQSQLYQDYTLDNDYTFFSGVVCLPVATADTTESPVDTIQVHLPYRMRTVRFNAKKDATPPVIPSPQTTGAFTFVGGTLGVAAPMPLSNNQFQWTVGGELTFVCTASDSDGLILGNRPMIFEQQAVLSPQPNGSDLPEDVQAAGRGPITGYRLGETVDLTNPAYTYGEISYFPATFFSSDLVTGPASYPNYS